MKLYFDSEYTPTILNGEKFYSIRYSLSPGQSYLPFLYKVSEEEFEEKAREKGWLKSTCHNYSEGSDAEFECSISDLTYEEKLEYLKVLAYEEKSGFGIVLNELTINKLSA